MGRRIWRFFGLKVVEFGAFFGIPFSIGSIARFFPNYIAWLEVEGTNFWSIWGIGFVTMFMPFIVAICLGGSIYILVELIKKNWEWAE